MMQVVVVPHDARWVEAFTQEAKNITQALGQSIAAIHHIGSTAIPGIYAKRIIDILVEVASVDDMDAQSGEMEAIGYEVMGEHGILGRRYFRKDNRAGIRTHHIHAFNAGSSESKKHLTFRDFMRAHSDQAAEYSDLKRKLAAAHPEDIDAYMDRKEAFIDEMDKRAAAWRASVIDCYCLRGFSLLPISFNTALGNSRSNVEISARLNLCERPLSYSIAEIETLYLWLRLTNRL